MNRSTIPAWVRTRHGAHDRLSIQRMGAGYDPTRGIVNFAGKIERNGRVKDFKGAATCAHGAPLLIVWSM